MGASGELPSFKPNIVFPSPLLLKGVGREGLASTVLLGDFVKHLPVAACLLWRGKGMEIGKVLHCQGLTQKTKHDDLTCGFSALSLSLSQEASSPVAPHLTSISVAALSFIVQEPRGIMLWTRETSLF